MASSNGEILQMKNIAHPGMMATNDLVESPCALLTCPLLSFGQLLELDASAVGDVRVNADFHQDFNNLSLYGAHHGLSVNMHNSLSHYKLAIASAVC